MKLEADEKRAPSPANFTKMQSGTKLSVCSSWRKDCNVIWCDTYSMGHYCERGGTGMRSCM